jgi:hypothetical protein
VTVGGIERSADTLTPRNWGTLAATSLSILGLILLAPGWALYVFESSQAGYLVAVVGAILTAGTLGGQRRPMLLVFLVATLALLGPEARGTLAAGRAPLGDARIFDLALIAGALSASIAWWLALSGRPSGRVRIVAGRWSRALGHRYALVVLGLLLIWAFALWVREGAPVDAATRTDLRLVLIGFLTMAAVAATRSLDGRPLILGLLLVGPLLLAKSAAIDISDLWVIGTNDRLQATVHRDGLNRVILAGGDTVLALLPAMATLAWNSSSSRWQQLACLLGGGAGVAGILISGTRTSVLVALSLGILALVWKAVTSKAILRTLLAVVATTAGGVALVYAVGILGRLPTEDAPHVGVNFRIDEVRTILDLPTHDLLLGQGIGGRFVGKDVNGMPTVTAWAHSYPLWALLKGGVLAVAGGILLCGLLIRTARTRIRLPHGRESVMYGVLIVTGVLGLSLSLGRAALVEGVVMLTLGTGLVSLGEKADEGAL